MADTKPHSSSPPTPPDVNEDDLILVPIKVDAAVINQFCV